MQIFIEAQELLKTKHPIQFSLSEVDLDKIKQKKEDTMRKDLAEQDEILKTIEQTHTECSKRLTQFKEEISELINQAPKKFGVEQDGVR